MNETLSHAVIIISSVNMLLIFVNAFVMQYLDRKGKKENDEFLNKLEALNEAWINKNTIAKKQVVEQMYRHH